MHCLFSTAKKIFIPFSAIPVSQHRHLSVKKFSLLSWRQKYFCDLCKFILPLSCK